MPLLLLGVWDASARCSVAVAVRGSRVSAEMYASMDKQAYIEERLLFAT